MILTGPNKCFKTAYTENSQYYMYTLSRLPGNQLDMQILDVAFVPFFSVQQFSPVKINCRKLQGKLQECLAVSGVRSGTATCNFPSYKRSLILKYVLNKKAKPHLLDGQNELYHNDQITGWSNSLFSSEDSFIIQLNDRPHYRCMESTGPCWCPSYGGSCRLLRLPL